MKAVVAAFNQEKALVGAFSVIVKTGCGTDGSICGTSYFHNTCVGQSYTKQSVRGEEITFLATLKHFVMRV